MTDIVTERTVTESPRPIGLMAGDPPLRGLPAETVYLATAEWLGEVVRQLHPEAGPDTPPHFSPNLLFSYPDIQLYAAHRGMHTEAAAVMLFVAAFHLGDIFGSTWASPETMEAGMTTSPAELTSPATKRGHVCYLLTQTAAELRARSEEHRAARVLSEQPELPELPAAVRS